MEPAAILCAGLAGITLGAWATTRRRVVASALVDRLRLPAPSRLVATATLVTLWLAATPKAPASADPVPPLVRLGGEESEPVVAPVTAPTHVVQPGDTLWRIAAATLAQRTGGPATSGEIARFWPEIYERNRAVIGTDPDLILPGQRLVLP